MQSYFERLSKKVVVNGAGLLELFFRDLQKLESKGKYPQEVTKFETQKVPGLSVFSQTISAAGELKNFSRGLSSAASSVKSSFSKFGSLVSETFSSSKNDFEKVNTIDLTKNNNLSDKPKSESNKNSTTSSVLAKDCSFDDKSKVVNGDLVINEVAWMGTDGSYLNEWIEIKNKSNRPISLAGYQLVDRAEQIDFKFSSKAKIKANDFYLVARNKDFFEDANPNFVYSGSLSNGSEGLKLYDGNCSLKDKVIASGGWPAGSNKTNKTMIRTGQDSLKTSSKAGGTPGAKNKMNEPKKVNPTVSTDRKEVRRGEIIKEKGKGFSPNSKVKMYFQIPNGKQVTSLVTTNQEGRFSKDYRMPKRANFGEYEYWAVDQKTKKKSNRVQYKVVEREKGSSGDNAQDNKDVPSNEKNKKKDKSKNITSNKTKKDWCGFSDLKNANSKLRFSEINWAGSTLSPYDEWIELKNVSSENINLEGYQVLSRDGDIKIRLKGNLLSSEFYLLERTNETSVGNVEADKIYEGGLANSGESLAIFNQNCSVVDFVKGRDGWPAGKAEGSGKTMARFSSGSWKNSDTNTGTPKTENEFSIKEKGNSKNKSENSARKNKKSRKQNNDSNRDAGKQEEKEPQDSQSNNNSNQKEEKEKEENKKTFFKGDVLISEIMYNLKGSDQGREWVELKNESGKSVDISQWRFSEGGTDHLIAPDHKGKLYLRPFERMVLANNKSKFLANNDIKKRKLAKSYFSLKNSSESLKLKTGEGKIISEVVYKEQWGGNGNGNSVQIANGSWGSGKPTPGNPNTHTPFVSNERPKSRFNFSPSSPKVGTKIEFSSSGAEDPDKNIDYYKWIIGNNFSTTTQKEILNYTTQKAGSFEVVLKVVDKKGKSDVSSQTVEVSKNKKEDNKKPPSSAFSRANNIVLSEILFDVEGSDEGREFIELYNPTSETKNLRDWLITHPLKKSTSSDTLVSFGSRKTDSLVIPPNNYLLVGFSNYVASSSKPDIVRSSSLPNGYDPYKLQLLNASSSVVDSIQYKAGLISGPGDSLERMAWGNSKCLNPLVGRAGEPLGNSCQASGVSEFVSRAHPNPQNLSSFKEPRKRPSGPNPKISYQKDSLNIEFNWDRYKNFQGSKKDMKYKIKLFDDFQKELYFASSTYFSWDVQEIGKDYTFSFRAYDSGGLSSKVVTTTVAVPSFFESSRLYKGPSTSSNIWLDFSTQSYPFVPNLYKGGRKAVVFYKSSSPDPPKVLKSDSGWKPSNIESVAKITYEECGGSSSSNYTLLLADGSGGCSLQGGALNAEVMNYKRASEDNYIKLRLSEWQPNDKASVSAAFYSLFRSGGGKQDFKRVATENNIAQFSPDFPGTQPPSVKIASTSFSKNSSNLKVAWNKASDSDTFDDDLNYEINFSSQPVINKDNWKKVAKGLQYNKTVSTKDKFVIGLRAQDNFGNYSRISTTTWEYPKSKTVLVQNEINAWSRSWGSKSNSNYENGKASYQALKPTRDISFKKAAVRLKEEEGRVDTFHLRIYTSKSTEKPNLSKKIADASRSIRQPNPQKDQIFNFPAEVTLQAGKLYWFILSTESDYRNQWQTGIHLHPANPIPGRLTGFGPDSKCSGEGRCEPYDIPAPSKSADWYLKLLK
ncbi:MAG: lamin tail domain-containing protein [Candidatus Magasanikbacteria bacterium]